MPTKRRRRAQVVRAQLTDQLRRFLETGDYARSAGGEWLDIFTLAGAVIHGLYDRLRAAWAEHGAAILADWIEQHPGTRPFAWWCLEAPARRRVVQGGELVVRIGDEVWRREFGVPPTRPIVRYDDPPFVVESEAAYLDRLGLLGRAERRELAAEDFEPETVERDGLRLETAAEVTWYEQLCRRPGAPMGYAALPRCP